MKVVKPSDEERDVPRGVVGGAEISQATTGATNIYMGVFRVPAGARSRPHYHEACESAVYMLSGRLLMRMPGGDQTYEAGQAFYWAPGHAPFALTDCSYVDFSPSAELAAVVNHISGG